MIENFVRRPSTPGEWIADLVRVLGVVSVAVAGVWWTGTDAGILAFALPALLVPRFLGVRAWFDILYGVIVVSAAWSNVLDLYTTVPRWDDLLHFLCTGVLAAMLFLGLAEVGVVAPVRELRPRTPLVLVTALGLAISAIWEMIEWFGHTFISDTIFVGYTDTIGDMVAGALGSVAGSTLVAFVVLLREE